MAGSLIVWDRSSDRRARAREAAEAVLRTAGFTDTGHFERDDVLVVWGTAPGAPISVANESSRDAVLIGDRLPVGSSGATDARALGLACAGGGDPGPADGFHLGVVVDHEGITVVVDTLATMPLYHHRIGDCVVIATGPALLRCHDAVALRLDPVGVTGVMLTGNAVGDSSCFRDVRRVAPHHHLRVSRSGSIGLTEQTRLDLTPVAPDVPFRELALETDDRLRAVCRRHLSLGRSVAQLLSGGLDSRLMAAAAHAAGQSFVAYTVGDRHDLEYRFSRRVSSALGIEHSVVPDPVDHRHFESILRWEGLHSAPVIEDARLPIGHDRCFSGHGLDNSLGASDLDWAYDPATRRAGPDELIATWNRRGVDRLVLQRLLAGGAWGAPALEGAVSTTHDVFLGAAPDLLGRAWTFELHHNDRYWVGMHLVREAARAWPLIPQYDLELLRIVERIPLVAIEGRRLEKSMLQQRYPELAALPLDRANFDVDALTPVLADQLRAVAMRRSIALRKRLRLPVREVRHGARLHDFDNDQWQRVRHRLEPARAHLHELFAPDVVDEVLPRPDVPSAPNHHFPRSNGAKMLLGIAAMLEDGIGA